ncbi:MAG TPA: hypothetical protein VKW76_10445 [Candidatus Binatia bacterium]|nr:hypothetical protein [Candidatus Binatia bacterium]
MSLLYGASARVGNTGSLGSWLLVDVAALDAEPAARGGRYR